MPAVFDPSTVTRPSPVVEIRHLMQSAAFLIGLCVVPRLRDEGAEVRRSHGWRLTIGNSIVTSERSG